MNKTIISLLALSTTLLSTQVMSASSANAEDYSEQITQRQDAFEQVEKLAEQAEDSFDGDDTDWKALATTSAKLADHSQQLLMLFPQGSHENSKAKESIWQKPEKFDRLLMQMDEGFNALYQASIEQNISQAEAGLEKAQDTCNSCYRSYRSRW